MKKDRWDVKIKQDGVIRRTNWWGKGLSDGYTGEIIRNGATVGYVFGKTESEVMHEAEKHRRTILEVRRREDDAEVYPL